MVVRPRPELDAEREKVSKNKYPLGMSNLDRLELMEILLEIQKIAGEAFDIVDSQLISEADVFLVLQLPDWCNMFGERMQKHAKQMIERKKGRNG